MGKHTENKSDSRNFLKVLLVVVIIAVICIAGYMAIMYFDKGGKPVKTEANTQTTNNKVGEEKKVEENVVEQPVVDPAPEAEIKQEQEVPVEENVEKENTNTTPNVEETSISDEDKAIELAKKQYGNTDGVYFRIEQPLSNGVFEVSVRDAETTAEYAWYTIDVRKGTVK